MEKDFKIIDLTHTLSEVTPTWDGSCGFELSTTTDYKDCTPPNLFRVQKIQCGAGVGTHMDAPSHVIPGERTIDQLELSELVVDCVVIDVSENNAEDYIVTSLDIKKFESKFGAIPENSFVLFYTGWSKHWNDREKYHNNHIFPSLDISSAKILVERKIVGLGTDTLSCDRGDNGFPVHGIVLGAGKYLVENIANADKLPPLGSKICVLPVKIKDGTEAPIRLIAFI